VAAEALVVSDEGFRLCLPEGWSLLKVGFSTRIFRFGTE
jgi:hypothetical protein